MIGDFILQETPPEEAGYHSAKITYLQEENKYLQDYVKDLEQVIQINKETLKIMSSQSFHVGSRSKLSSEDDTTASIMENRHSPGKSKSFYTLYEQLQEENSRLLTIIEKLKQSRAEAQTRALLSEQVAEEAERRELETRTELEEKILELRKKVQEKEYFIGELEKLKPYPDQEGVVVKYREIMDVTEQNMRIHEELNSYKAMLVKVAKEYNKVQQEKGEMKETNIKLMSELTKLRAVMAHPVTPKHSFKIFDKFKEVLNRSHFRNHNRSPSSNSPIKLPEENSPLSPKSPLKTSKADSHTLKPSLFKQEKRQELSNKRHSSPYRTTNVLYDMKLLEKISELENELEYTKNVLTRESMNNKSLSDELTKLRRICTDVLATNEILCKSNKRYQEKWDKLFQAMEFYKGFYQKYVDLITGSKGLIKTTNIELPTIEDLNKINEALGIELDTKATRKPSNKLEIEFEMEELEKEYPKEEEKREDKKKNGYELTKEQAKVYLLGLAKDFNGNLHSKKDAQNNLHKRMASRREGRKLHRATKSKRSVSNPLDYIFERKSKMYEPVTDDQREEAIRKNQEKRRKTLEHLKHIETQKIAESFEAGLMHDGPLNMRVKRSTHSHRKGEFDNHSFSIDSDGLNEFRDGELSFISTDDFVI